MIERLSVGCLLLQRRLEELDRLDLKRRNRTRWSVFLRRQAFSVFVNCGHFVTSRLNALDFRAAFLVEFVFPARSVSRKGFPCTPFTQLSAFPGQCVRVSICRAANAGSNSVGIRTTSILRTPLQIKRVCGDHTCSENSGSLVLKKHFLLYSLMVKMYDSMGENIFYHIW